MGNIGREEGFEVFFFPRMEKKTVQKPNKCSKSQKSLNSDIFVKIQNYNNFQVFGLFFFLPEGKKQP